MSEGSSPRPPEALASAQFGSSLISAHEARTIVGSIRHLRNGSSLGISDSNSFGAHMTLPPNMNAVRGVSGESPALLRRFGAIDEPSPSPLDQVVEEGRGVSSALWSYQWPTCRLWPHAPAASSVTVSIGVGTFALPSSPGERPPIGPVLTVSEWSKETVWLDYAARRKLYGDLIFGAGLETATGASRTGDGVCFDPPPPALVHASWRGTRPSSGPLRFYNLASMAELRRGAARLFVRMGPCVDAHFSASVYMVDYAALRPALDRGSRWWSLTALDGLRRPIEDYLEGPSQRVWAPLLSLSRLSEEGAESERLYSGFALEGENSGWHIAAYGMGASVAEIRNELQEALGLELEVTDCTDERI